MLDPIIDAAPARLPICPYCGYTDSDPSEIGGGEQGVYETECDSCGATFWLERRITIGYVARPPAFTPDRKT